MNMDVRLRVITYCLAIVLTSTGGVYADDRNALQEQEIPSLTMISGKLKQAIQADNYEIIKPYVSNKKLLYWTACGPGDVEPEKLSFVSIVKRLSRISKGAQVYVHEEPDIHLWDFEKPIYYSVIINTEGWVGEYPYLSFGFDFRPASNSWEFRGVCDSTTPQLTKKNEQSVPAYPIEPKLPRPGPRIFKDIYALRARIEEIIRFKAFDALIPYATRKALIFSQCNLEMMEKDGIVGKETSITNVINFLKNSTKTSNQPISSGALHNTYYETTGWSGDYPYIAFWFSESSKGWELAGVSYCKTKHFDLFSSVSPLK